MPPPPTSPAEQALPEPRGSHERYRQYRLALRRRETEGTKDSADAHARERRRQRKVQRSFFALFRAFTGMLRPYRRGAILALGTVTISTGLALISPALTGVVLDSVLGERPAPEILARLGVGADRRALLLLITSVIVIASVLSISIHMWGRKVNTVITKRLQASLRRRVFAHAVRLPLDRVQQLKSGGVASLLREDAGSIPELLFSMIYNPWRSVVQLIATLVILALIDWRLLLGSLVIFPTVWLTHRAWIARIRPIYKDIRFTRQHIDSHATEAFAGMRVVRAFGRQRSEAGRFTRGNHFMTRQEMLVWWWSRVVDIAWAVLIPLATALLLLYGGLRILGDAGAVEAGSLAAEQALTAGQLVTFLFYLALLLEPMAVLANSATAFQSSLAALDRVLDLLEESKEFPSEAGAARVTPTAIRGRIELRDVSFTYPRTTQSVLNHVSLVAEPGESIALVGASGSGKTTLTNLIARFYDPTHGAILIDGRDLREIDVESYRRLLGVVEQDVFLFDGTIRENIAYARRDASIEEIHAAARRAHADEFILRFEHGYGTIVGERGVRLSGGQRQRLAIARAILADPRILILDEATSNLDSENERLIQESLADLLRGRTSFVIAHRLSTIVHADRIVVLHEGVIAESGSHAELMALGGRYAEMVRMQALSGAGR